MTGLVSGSPQQVVVVYGTRPEVIKLAPVVYALRRRSADFEVSLCSTGQHREVVGQMEELFGLEPDYRLNLMERGQSLNIFAARALTKLDEVLRNARPDRVLVQGDTTTVAMASLAAFHQGIPLGHVEAGLRTGDLAAPFPEEANRRISDMLADLKFAPTSHSRARLLEEGYAADEVIVTGNTIVDALQWIVRRVPHESVSNEVLMTLHRRESFGVVMKGILRAIRVLAARFPEVRWVLPVHPNPNVAEPVFETLGGLPNVRLCDPMPYDAFVRQLQRARIVLTDSGGVQEETPTFRTPTLVLRDKTERPEGIAAGVAHLVGTDPERIIEETTRVLEDPQAYEAMIVDENPYGDGRASERIAAILAGDPLQELQNRT